MHPSRVRSGYAAVRSGAGLTSTRDSRSWTSARLIAFGLQLLGTHLAVEKRDRGEVLQVVVRLFLGQRALLFAVAAATGEVVGALEDLEGHRCDVTPER